MLDRRLPILLTAVLSMSLACSKIREKVTGAAGTATADDATSALAGFEGDLGIRATSAKDKKPIEVLVQIKGDRTRVNLQGQLSEATSAVGMADGYGLLQMKEKRAYFVSDSAKKAIAFDLEKAKEQVPGMGTGQKGGASAPPGSSGQEAASNMKLQKTGKTDRVAGFPCDEWEATDAAQPGSKLQVCVANQGASWLALPLRALPGNASAMAELLDGKHFPLRMVAFKRDAEELRVEVTKVEKKTLADALFSVPSGYQEIDLMTAMLGGLGGMGMGAPGGLGGLPPGYKLPPGVKLPVVKNR